MLWDHPRVRRVGPRYIIVCCCARRTWWWLACISISCACRLMWRGATPVGADRPKQGTLAALRAVNAFIRKEFLARCRTHLPRLLHDASQLNLRGA